ncbi:hypothetical protein LTR51_002694 [Lithohypha guttulata]|uniref:DNA 3'-5' helicase n=2 Tax=Lithohypha guttulata TaxID=1690604 RepID=A0AAN7SVW8_9EURO|nr:hypothetical protein LTR51_002694 [Lithohypha guttulata]KAK5082877.1 hypothetical protein LTR05_006758 [Lithohypha guttulata]
MGSRLQTSIQRAFMAKIQLAAAERTNNGFDSNSNTQTWLTSIHNRRCMMLRHLQPQTRPDNTTPKTVPAVNGIIYVNTRNLTESLASKLQSAGINANAYHAGLEPMQRLKIQNQFIRQSAGGSPQAPLDKTLDTEAPPVNNEDIFNSFNIITATNAFGMGIDIPTIRFVVHYGLPRNLESFIQESGRAGRDGKAAQSLVLYTREERDRTIYRVKLDMQKDAAKKHNRGGFVPAANARLNSQFNPTTQMSATQPEAQAEQRTKSLQKVIEYCENVNVCRHKTITEYFGQPGAGVQTGAASSRSIVQSEVICDMACDVCKEGIAGVRRRKDRGLASDEEASQFTQRQNWDYG